MVELPLRLPASLQTLGGDFNKRRQEAASTSAGVTGAQIQELLARIKAAEATKLQGQKNEGQLANTLAGLNLSPGDPNLAAKQEENRGAGNFLTTAQASKLAAETGVFPQNAPGSVRDIVSGNVPNLRATPLEILKNTALNPSTKVGREVKNKTVIGQGKKPLGPSVQTITESTETKRPGGLPGLGLPGTEQNAVEGESQRLQQQALEKMQGSLDEATIKAIFEKLKPGEIIVDFDPETRKVIIRRPGGATGRQ